MSFGNNPSAGDFLRRRADYFSIRDRAVGQRPIRAGFSAASSLPLERACSSARPMEAPMLDETCVTTILAQHFPLATTTSLTRRKTSCYSNSSPTTAAQSGKTRCAIDRIPASCARSRPNFGATRSPTVVIFLPPAPPARMTVSAWFLRIGPARKFERLRTAALARRRDVLRDRPGSRARNSKN